MIDEMTKDGLRVSTDGIAGPFLMVPVTQLDAVLAVLNRHKVRYWVDADAISLDNGPATTVINSISAEPAKRSGFRLSSTRPADGRAPSHAPIRRHPRPGRQLDDAHCLPDEPFGGRTLSEERRSSHADQRSNIRPVAQCTGQSAV